MSDESDVKILVELSHLSTAVRQYGEGQGRVLQQVENLRSEIHIVADRVNHVEDRVERAERTALDAKRMADATSVETGQIHKAWQVHAEALKITVDNVRRETESQTEKLDQQNVTLDKLVEAGERAELHRQWQRDQAAEQEQAKLKRRATIAWTVSTFTGLVAIVTAIYAVVVWLRAMKGK